MKRVLEDYSAHQAQLSRLTSSRARVQDENVVWKCSERMQLQQGETNRCEEGELTS